MEKIANILTKVAAIALVVIGALALIGNVVLIIEGGFSVAGIIVALLVLACGVLLINFAMKGNAALHVIIVLAIALVLVLVDRFALGAWTFTSFIFAYLSPDFATIFVQIMSVLTIILAVDVAAALVLKVIPMIKK